MHKQRNACISAWPLTLMHSFTPIMHALSAYFSCNCACIRHQGLNLGSKACIYSLVPKFSLKIWIFSTNACIWLKFLPYCLYACMHWCLNWRIDAWIQELVPKSKPCCIHYCFYADIGAFMHTIAARTKTQMRACISKNVC